MFVRLRTSSTNLYLIDRAVAAWTADQHAGRYHLHVVLRP